MISKIITVTFVALSFNCRFVARNVCTKAIPEALWKPDNEGDIYCRTFMNIGMKKGVWMTRAELHSNRIARASCTLCWVFQVDRNKRHWTRREHCSRHHWYWLEVAYTAAEFCISVMDQKYPSFQTFNRPTGMERKDWEYTQRWMDSPRMESDVPDIYIKKFCQVKMEDLGEERLLQKNQCKWQAI